VGPLVTKERIARILYSHSGKEKSISKCGRGAGEEKQKRKKTAREMERSKVVKFKRKGGQERSFLKGKRRWAGRQRRSCRDQNSRSLDLSVLCG